MEQDKKNSRKNNETATEQQGRRRERMKQSICEGINSVNKKGDGKRVRKKYFKINFNPSSYQSASNELQHATTRFVM